jgi:hypothetical protein
MEKRTPLLTLVAVVAVSIIGLSACQPSTAPQSESMPATSPTVASPTPSTAPLMQDGSSSQSKQQVDQVVTYDNPGGGDPVRFQLTVENGVITAASSEVLADNPVSQKYQTGFKEALAGAVVGKKLSELQVDRIGGASLTSGAFRTFIKELNDQKNAGLSS